MNSLERALIAKAGYDNGWEVTVEDSVDRVILASALHRAKAEIVPDASLAAKWRVRFDHGTLAREVGRNASRAALSDHTFAVSIERDLGQLLQEAARLARALPDAPEIRFAQTVTKELEAKSITATEIERMVRQRVGQDIYRDSLMDYWSGACAVTGIAVPELLRASHAKAWAECDTDAERLNIFNGFLLVAHLDALFDRYLMTFDDAGTVVFAANFDSVLRAQLGLTGNVKLRWVSPGHQEFLTWHRARFQHASSIPLDTNNA